MDNECGVGDEWIVGIKDKAECSVLNALDTFNVCPLSEEERLMMHDNARVGVEWEVEVGFCVAPSTWLTQAVHADRSEHGRMPLVKQACVSTGPSRGVLTTYDHVKSFVALLLATPKKRKQRASQIHSDILAQIQR